MTSGPSLSAGERERGKGEWPAGWLGHGPRRGRGHRGFWAKRPKERKGEEKSFFVFIFPNKFFKLFSKCNLNSNSFAQSHTSQKKLCQHECNIKC